MKKIVLITILMSLLFMSPLVLSQETELLYGENEKNLPPNLQKIAEYNNQQAQFYLKNLSFLIAFLAGIKRSWFSFENIKKMIKLLEKKKKLFAFLGRIFLIQVYKIEDR